MLFEHVMGGACVFVRSCECMALLIPLKKCGCCNLLFKLFELFAHCLSFVLFIRHAYSQLMSNPYYPALKPVMLMVSPHLPPAPAQEAETDVEFEPLEVCGLPVAGAWNSSHRCIVWNIAELPPQQLVVLRAIVHTGVSMADSLAAGVLATAPARVASKFECDASPHILAARAASGVGPDRLDFLGRPFGAAVSERAKLASAGLGLVPEVAGACADGSEVELKLVRKVRFECKWK